MAEWMNVRKKPIIVQVRYATRRDEEMIRRREGSECLEALGLNQDEDVWPYYMVMRGGEGEEYPIKWEVFRSTYDVVEEGNG
jgi:hypothetical protein